jgi:hypothetical protein
VARVPAVSGDEAALEWMVAWFWWFPGTAKLRTVLGRSRRVRVRGLQRRFLPVTAERHDWRWSGRQVLRVVKSGVDSLRFRTSGDHQAMR